MHSASFAPHTPPIRYGSASSAGSAGPCSDSSRSPMRATCNGNGSGSPLHTPWP
jgi:hypothetical protein